MCTTPVPGTGRTPPPVPAGLAGIVVAVTAVNPNTVLKAYRDLEREGLVEARSGQGTFVRGRPQGPPPRTHARLGRALATWVREARAAGRTAQARPRCSGS